MDALNASSPRIPANSPGLAALDATLARGQKPDLRALTGELETMFLSLLMKEMRQTLESEGGLFAGDAGDVYGGLFDFYLGKHLADAGGIGLARSLAAPMERSLQPERPHDANSQRPAAGAGLPRSPSP